MTPQVFYVSAHPSFEDVSAQGFVGLPHKDLLAFPMSSAPHQRPRSRSPPTSTKLSNRLYEPSKHRRLDLELRMQEIVDLITDDWCKSDAQVAVKYDDIVCRVLGWERDDQRNLDKLNKADAEIRDLRRKAQPNQPEMPCEPPGFTGESTGPAPEASSTSGASSVVGPQLPTLEQILEPLRGPGDVLEAVNQSR